MAQGPVWMFPSPPSSELMLPRGEDSGNVLCGWNVFDHLKLYLAKDDMGAGRRRHEGPTEGKQSSVLRRAMKH